MMAWRPLQEELTRPPPRPWQEWLLSDAGGADASSKDNEGDPVLHLAAGHNEAAIVQMLLDAGAEIEARDSDGSTALALACILGHYETAQALLCAGAKVASKWQGLTPTQWASAETHSSLVHSSLVCSVCISPIEPLHLLCRWAGEYGHETIVSLLTSFGGEHSAIPRGKGPQALSSEGLSAANRLRPAPERSRPRRTPGQRPGQAWEGHRWATSESLLQALEGDGREEIVERFPSLAALPAALRAYIEPAKRPQHCSPLPPQTISSMRILPGVLLRRAKGNKKLEAATKIDASVFGTHIEQGYERHFASIEHEHEPTCRFETTGQCSCPYKEYLAELVSPPLAPPPSPPPPIQLAAFQEGALRVAWSTEQPSRPSCSFRNVSPRLRRISAH